MPNFEHAVLIAGGFIVIALWAHFLGARS